MLTIWLFWVNILCNLIVFGYLGDEYIFYYESHRYYMTNESNINNKNIDIRLNENISIHIVLNNDDKNFLYINNKPLINDYNNDNEYNEIQTFESSLRRRLRSCHWNHCWWGRCHKHHYYCKPKAPPKKNAYWVKRYYRKGRFIGFFPGYRRYNYKQCSHHCRQHYGGLASIVSDVEQKEVVNICKDILEKPTASPAAVHQPGHWRGASCYIGLQRPFTEWDDQRKADKYKNWSPGQPDNAGNRENCGEVWAFHNGEWNDVSCNSKKSCICQDPRGIFYGKYIAVQAERRYHQAEQHCQDRYGTTLATIANNEENDQVLKACQKIIIKGAIGSCWIGLQRPFYRWNDGSYADEKFTNWYPGEPNNKREKCSELYSTHDGKWNDLPCHYHRYFVCNALSQVERMPYHEREELIAKRLQRHRFKWERSQAKVHRQKMSKALWSQMREMKAQLAKSKRTQRNKYNEELRKHMFNNLYPGVPYSSFGHNNNFIMSSAKLFGGSRLEKQATHRRLLLKQKQYNRYDPYVVNNKMNIIQTRKNDMNMRRLVDIADESMLFGDDGIEDDIDDNIDDNIDDISHRKCIMVSVMGVMYELCIGTNYIDVKRFIGKQKKENMFGGLIGMDFENDNVYNYNLSMEFVDFEDWKHRQILLMEHRKLDQHKEIEEIVKYDADDYFTRFMQVYSMVYDNDNNHQMQCWSEVRPYHICMELDDDNMIVSTKERDVFRDTFIKFEFNNDEYWDDVVRHYDMNGNEISIEKCRRFYSTKLCVLKSVDNIYKMKIVRHRDDGPSVDDL